MKEDWAESLEKDSNDDSRYGWEDRDLLAYLEWGKSQGWGGLKLGLR